MNSVSRDPEGASMSLRSSPRNSAYFGWVLIIQNLHQTFTASVGNPKASPVGKAPIDPCLPMVQIVIHMFFL
jgi:hypothetical protein